MTSLRILPMTLALGLALTAGACVKSGQVVDHGPVPQRTFQPRQLCNSTDTQSLCTPISAQPILIDTNLVAPGPRTPTVG